MQDLLASLGNPERNFKILHVAGTNGKGSTCAYLDAMLGKAKIYRGLYTSPHLSCARERIQINGEMLSEEEWIELEQLVGTEATFFEKLTAMAFLAFARHEVEVAVVEVGLGGRLDATNIVTPIVCGITSIDLDHTAFLGDNLESIAREKAGIIKPEIPIVVGDLCPAAMKVMPARAIHARLPQHIQPGLVGEHQRNNAAVAWTMMDVSGLIPDENIRRVGLEEAKWPGRYETVSDDPIVILDGAHNPAGLNSLVETLKNDRRLFGKPLILVVGMTTGHDHVSMMQVLQTLHPQMIIATEARSPRALPCEQIAVATHRENSVKEAIPSAMKHAKQIEGYVIVTGSLYVVGEARAVFFDVPCDPELPLY